MNTIEDLCELIDRVVRDSATGASEQITAETELLITGLLDSLTIMKIVTELERAHGVVLPDGEIVASTFRSPRTLWDALEAIRGAETAVRP